MNNDSGIVKGKIDSPLNEAFKSILSKMNLTQQDFVEQAVKKFVLDNLYILMDKGSK